MTVVFPNNMQMTVITVSRCSLLAECEHLLGRHRLHLHLHLRLGGTQHSQVAAVTQHHDLEISFLKMMMVVLFPISPVFFCALCLTQIGFMLE